MISLISTNFHSSEHGNICLVQFITFSLLYKNMDHPQLLHLFIKCMPDINLSHFIMMLMSHNVIYWKCW